MVLSLFPSSTSAIRLLKEFSAYALCHQPNIQFPLFENTLPFNIFRKFSRLWNSISRLNKIISRLPSSIPTGELWLAWLLETKHQSPQIEK